MNINHDVLKHVFPDIRFLFEFLNVCCPGKQLLFENDSKNFKDLVNLSLIGLNEVIPEDLDFVQKEAHVSVVNGLVSELVRANVKSKAKNVLCNGLRLHTSMHMHGVDGMNGIECTFPNSALNAIRGASWELLHSRIGTDLFRFILKNAMIFFPLPNNCYLQMCGLEFSSFRKSAKMNSSFLNNNKIHKNTLERLQETQQAPFESGGVEEKKKARVAPKLAPVMRSRIFYDEKYVKKAGFSASHILESKECQPRLSFAKTLCRIVFQQKSGRLKKRYVGIVDHMLALVKNHTRIKYGFFLRIYCGILSQERNSASDELCVEDIIGYETSYKDLIKVASKSLVILISVFKSAFLGFCGISSSVSISLVLCS